MLDGLIGLAAIIALVVMSIRQHQRVSLLERELGALRSFVLSGAAMPKPTPVAGETVAVPATLLDAGPGGPAAPQLTLSEESIAPTPDVPGSAPQPWAAAPESAPGAAVPPRPAKPRDLETALGTRWAVWVGGIALALGGIFLVRYTIEAGFFGPGARLILAGLFGLALAAAGEFVRRTGFTGPVEGAAGAYVPGILTAAGSFVLFGAVYAAHGVYGFIGPGLAFSLLGLIGLATLALALVHGQALAGVGLLGSLVTPILVSSQSPSAWTLFGYIAIVLVANTAVARIRDWRFLAGAGFAGAGLWSLVYLAGTTAPSFTVLLFVNAVWLGALAFVWLPRHVQSLAPAEEKPREIDWPSVFPAIFSGFAVIVFLADVDLATGTSVVYGLVLAAAMVAVAVYRPAALPLLHGAGVAAFLIHLRLALSSSIGVEVLGADIALDTVSPGSLPPSPRLVGLALLALFLVAGLGQALRLVATAPRRAAVWAAWAAIVPVSVVAALWLATGNLDRDLLFAVLALILAAVLVGAAEMLGRQEQPEQAGGPAVGATLIGAGISFVFALHMAFGDALTTILIGASAALPAFATRFRAWPTLGWLAVGAVVATMGRIALDPTIVGADLLGKTPVFNVLLPGYGIPALAFAFAAWQLARTTAGRPRLVMEAAATLFGLLAIAMLVRHAMNGGVIDTAAPTLAEQAIYTILALGAGAILISIDRRSPSAVLRVGSLAAGVVSVALIVVQHYALLNPLFTDESTGSIPVFNLLFLAYLLPALAAAGLALYARGKRPRWYSAMLGLLAATLAFVYATLSVRRLFQGEHIAYWSGIGSLEYYSYSALWLAIGVALLVVGVLTRSYVVRAASGLLIAIAVAKVFLLDMSELEGVLRALSFIGLGEVLIGIGLFYQRLLTREALRAR